MFCILEGDSITSIERRAARRGYGRVERVISVSDSDGKQDSTCHEMHIEQFIDEIG